MKCRVESKRYKNQPNANQRKAIDQSCAKVLDEHIEKLTKEFLLQTMYVLRFNFGYGKKRLKRFINRLADLQKLTYDRYGAKDGDVPAICEIKLRDSGIDVDELLEGVEKE